jgi:hypothetical protein
MAQSWRHLHPLLIVLAAASAVEGAVRHVRLAVSAKPSYAVSPRVRSRINHRTATYSALANLVQQNGGISGLVTDETNRVLVDATITATDLESGRRFVGLTDERGEYRLLNVPPGRYELEVSREGFETATVRSLELLVGQFERVPFTLKVGALINGTVRLESKQDCGTTLRVRVPLSAHKAAPCEPFNEPATMQAQRTYHP